MGAKGLLTYKEAREQLPRALPLVANGGFWVPRAVLSGFVDSVLGGSHSRRLKADTSADLSRREQEVLNSLLENLANKEIGSKLNISERTVKFHVSNLLSKFGVRRRADLILLCYQKRSVDALRIGSRSHSSQFGLATGHKGNGAAYCGGESCYSRLVTRDVKFDRSRKTTSMPIDRRPEYFKGAQLRVGIIGCGYVGLPLGLRFAEAGHRVTGFDTDPAKVEKLNRGQTYIQHIPQNKIQQFVQSKHFGATTDFARLAEIDAVLICVPTPLDQRREPDLSYVEQTARAIRPYLQRGQLVVLESTTYPGTTEELVLPILEETGMKCPVAHGPDNDQIGTDFFLAFSPEREDPGNKQYGLAQIPKVVGGVNPPSGRAALALYAQIVARVVPVSSTHAAEMTKLLENIFRCVNIALVNELKMLGLAHGDRHLGSD